MKWPRSVLRDEVTTGDGGGGDPNQGLPDPNAPPKQVDVAAELDRMRQDIAGVRDAVQNRPVIQPAVDAPPQPGAPDMKAIEKEFWKNPLSVTAAITQTAVAQALQQNNAQSHDTMVEMAKTQAKARLSPEDAEIFEAYKTEIEQVVGTLQPQFQTNVNVWANATSAVFGRHVSDIVKIRMKKVNGSAAIKIGDGPSAPSMRGQPAPAKTPLTAEEKQWARNWDISEDEYRHGKEILDDQEKAFSEVITFSSKDKSRRERERAAAK